MTYKFNSEEERNIFMTARRKEIQERWKQKHKEETKEYNKKYYAAHRDARKQQWALKKQVTIFSEII